MLSWVESVTGALEDVPRLAAQAKDAGASVVVDATQAVGRVPLSLDETLDAVCWSAHKLGAPVGIGALRIAPDAPWGAPWGSGSQERGRRSGTEAVALASAFAAAVGVSVERLPRLPARADGVFAPLDAWAATTDEVQVVGRAPRRVLTTRLLTVPGCRGDLLVAALDRRGLRVSTGTACASGARTPAEVLLATGRTAREALSAVRISIGWGSTRAEIQALVDALREIVPTARGGHPES